MKETSDTFVSVSDCRPLGQRGKQKNNTSTADDVDKKNTHTRDSPRKKYPAEKIRAIRRASADPPSAGNILVSLLMRGRREEKKSSITARVANSHRCPLRSVQKSPIDIFVWRPRDYLYRCVCVTN